MENSFVTIYEGGRKGRPFRVDREETPNGTAVCYCVQYRGAGRYFSTEAECFAYLMGRGLLERCDNPWLLGHAKCINQYSGRNFGELPR